MRRAILPLLVLAAIATAAGLAWWTLSGGRWGGVGGGPGADAVTETRTLPPFHAIDVSGIADITLVQGDTDLIVIEASPRAQRQIQASVRNETLVIHAADERSTVFAMFGRTTRSSRITVTFRNLDAIEASGAVKIAAPAPLKIPALRISASGTVALRLENLQVQTLKLSGAGAVKADLAGRAAEQAVSISGAGKYDAPMLESDDARVAVSGAGKVIVNARKTLTINLSGAGLVEYVGDPQVKQSVSGVGKVRRRDAATDAPRRTFHVAAHSRAALSAWSPALPRGWSRA